MDVEIQWREPLPLRSLSQQELSRVHAQVHGEPGIYIFARRWGNSFEALYVGQALNMAARVKIQFNNHNLIEHVKNSRTGKKVLLTGYLSYRGFTNIPKSLDIAERAYIRFCVSQGHSLHNTQGTRLRTQEIFSMGGKKTTPFPKKIEVEIKK